MFSFALKMATSSEMTQIETGDKASRYTLLIKEHELSHQSIPKAHVSHPPSPKTSVEGSLMGFEEGKGGFPLSNSALLIDSSL